MAVPSSVAVSPLEIEDWAHPGGNINPRHVRPRLAQRDGCGPAAETGHVQVRPGSGDRAPAMAGRSLEAAEPAWAETGCNRRD
jgi:hypothetical protein